MKLKMRTLACLHFRLQLAIFQGFIKIILKAHFKKRNDLITYMHN
jgi:hypothetical protein